MSGKESCSGTRKPEENKEVGIEDEAGFLFPLKGRRYERVVVLQVVHSFLSFHLKTLIRGGASCVTYGEVVVVVVVHRSVEAVPFCLSKSSISSLSFFLELCSA